MYDYQEALAVASDIQQGYGQAYTDANLRAAASTLIRATGNDDISRSPNTAAAYRTIARYERGHNLLK